MNLIIEKQPDYLLARVEGRIDTTSAGEFEKKMVEAIGSDQEKIVLDCSELKYISSSGLRVFLVLQKKMNALGGKFLLCSLQPAIMEIFDISGFASIFAIKPDIEACIG